MRVRCTSECFIFGVLHHPGDEVDWPHKPEDYMIPLEADPVPVPEPVPKDDTEQEKENNDEEAQQEEEPVKSRKRGLRRKADNVTE